MSTGLRDCGKGSWDSEKHNEADLMEKAGSSPLPVTRTDRARAASNDAGNEHKMMAGKLAMLGNVERITSVLMIAGAAISVVLVTMVYSIVTLVLLNRASDGVWSRRRPE